MKTVITFDKADYDLLEKAQGLAERIYLAVTRDSSMERVANRALLALTDLVAEMKTYSIKNADGCASCAGDCAECHCEDCIEDEPETVAAEQLRAKVAEAIGCEPKGVEVVTTPTGAELLKALAEIFGA